MAILHVLCNSSHRRHVVRKLLLRLRCLLNSVALRCLVVVVLAPSMVRSVLMRTIPKLACSLAHSLVKRMRLALIRWALLLRLVCRC